MVVTTGHGMFLPPSPETRLFQEHNVDRKYDFWIHHEAFTPRCTRGPKILVKKLGTDGPPPSAANTQYVYAYRKNVHTFLNPTLYFPTPKIKYH